LKIVCLYFYFSVKYQGIFSKGDLIMSKKYVYLFTEGDASMRELLGGKGANLAEMTKLGLPVPQGFTISTEACTQYYEDGQKINPEIW
jgi:pyruvate,orthophosphate dikinase